MWMGSCLDESPFGTDTDEPLYYNGMLRRSIFSMYLSLLSLQILESCRARVTMPGPQNRDGIDRWEERKAAQTICCFQLFPTSKWFSPGLHYYCWMCPFLNKSDCWITCRSERASTMSSSARLINDGRSYFVRTSATGLWAMLGVYGEVWKK